MKKMYKARKRVIIECWGILPFNLDPFKPKGKDLKRARMLMPYGASIFSLTKETNLSIRRLKVLHKQYFGNPRARLLSQHNLIN